MAVLTAQTIVITGLTPVYSGVSANDEFANDGNMYLHVINGGGSPCNVTFTTPGKVAGVEIEDPVVAVPAGAERKIGPFPTDIFNAADGNVDVAFSFTTSVTAAPTKFN